VLQVANFDQCLLAVVDIESRHEDGTEDDDEDEYGNRRSSPLAAWWAAAPQHLQLSQWDDRDDEDEFLGSVEATYKYESKASLNAAGKHVGELRRG
jgi:hypothetical protein